MTWTGIDSARLADDEAAAALGVRIREDLADTAQIRTGCVSRTWGITANYRAPFSTPSDSWRTIPFILPKDAGTDSLSVRVRYLLDSAASSGISAPTDAGKIRLRVNGQHSDPVTVSVTGTVDTEAEITISTSHVADRGLIVGEVQFLSYRGGSGGSWNIEHTIGPNQLLITNTPSPTPTTSSAPHLEFDLDAAGHLPPVVHVCQVEAGSGGTYTAIARVWPFLDEGHELPVGGGKLVTVAAYKLPAWEVQSIAIEQVASAGAWPLPPVAAVQAGAHTSAGVVSALVRSLAGVVSGRPSVYTIGPSMTSGTQDYLTGMRTGATTKVDVGGAYLDRPSGEYGISALVAFCPRSSAHVGTELTQTLKATQRSGGSTSSTTTATLTIADGHGVRRNFDEAGTLHQLNIGDTTRSKWSPADTGCDGDVERLQYALISLDYPGDVGDLHEVFVSMTGADIWIGAVSIWGRVRL